jgi:hypothetical protein
MAHTYKFTTGVYREYCPISINSAAPMTRDTPAKILVSADARNGRDIIFFPAGWAGANFYFYCFYLSYPQINSALGQIGRDLCDISERRGAP